MPAAAPHQRGKEQPAERPTNFKLQAGAAGAEGANVFLILWPASHYIILVS